MERKKAIELINHLVYVECEVFKAVNTRKGGVSQRLQREENAAVADLFKAIIGERPSDAEIAEMQTL